MSRRLGYDHVVPKIKAATVPEHREAQRRALLAAARKLVLKQGLGALKFSELADAAGLARPSVYEYFKTRGDLVLALVHDEAPSWMEAISAAMKDVTEPQASIEQFVRAMLEEVKSGRHELPFALAAAQLEPEIQTSVADAHQSLFAMLAPHLKAMGVRDVPTCIELVGGVIMSAGQALRRDRARRGLIEQAVAFAGAGARAFAHRR